MSQALCGTRLDVPTLGGESVPLEFTESTLTPSTVKRVPGRGLPFPKDPSRRGDLLVAFDIVFPDGLTATAKETLRRTLPN